MSTMGTGPAAGVAQTAHNAQQVSRRNDKQVRDKRHTADRARDSFESHFQTVQEGEETEAANNVNINQQLPDHDGNAGVYEPPVDEEEGRSAPEPAHQDDGAEQEEKEATSHQPKPGPVPPDSPLYKHLDVKA